MAKPLVSILTPCFDDGATLGRALRSLVAQTMGDWECIVVDDGSGRSLRPVVEAVGDERIELIEFEKNRGRSVARQAALARARAPLVAMLDADDWYYPDKLACQIAVMDDHPELVALCTAVAVVDEANCLIGMRGAPAGPLTVLRGEPGRLPTAPFFPTIMIRRGAIGDLRFDPGLRRCEDREFLMRLFAHQRYGIMSRPLYAYREVYDQSAMDEALVGFASQRRIFGGLLGQYPLAGGRQYLKSVLKTGIYRAAQVVGGGHWLWARRNREPTASERAEFERIRHFPGGSTGGETCQHLSKNR